jgi:hypothetical protein
MVTVEAIIQELMSSGFTKRLLDAQAQNQLRKITDLTHNITTFHSFHSFIGANFKLVL